MKKIIALALVLVMMLAVAIPAFAADPATTMKDDEEAVVGTLAEANKGAQQVGTDDTVKVKYGVDQCYLVTIIADVTFGADLATPSQNLTVTNLKLAGNETMKVSVESPKAWVMEDQNGASAAVPYAMYLNGATDETAGKLQSDSTGTNNTTAKFEVLKVNRPNANLGTDPVKGEVAIVFKTDGTAQEGWYVDTLTFTVEIITGDVTATDTPNQTLDTTAAAG